jgi:hypothetical protein
VEATVTDPARERELLLQALRKAVATEVAEVKRLSVRLSAGYGDDWTRTTMRRSLEEADGRRRALIAHIADLEREWGSGVR